MKRSAHHFPRHLHPSPTFKNSTLFTSRPRNPPLLTPRPYSRKDAKTQRRKGLGNGSLRKTGLVGCGEAVGRLLSKPQRHPKSKHLIHHVHPSTAKPTANRYLSEPISSFLCVFASWREPGFPSGVVKRSTPSTAQPTTTLPIRTYIFHPLRLRVFA